VHRIFLGVLLLWLDRATTPRPANWPEAVIARVKGEGLRNSRFFESGKTCEVIWGNPVGSRNRKIKNRK